MSETPDQAAAAPAPPPLISAADIGLLLGLPALGALAWALPESAWPAFCDRFAGANLMSLSADRGTVARRVRAVFGQRAASLPVPPDSMARAIAGEDMLAGFQLMGSYRPCGWKPPVAVEGLAHLEAGLTAGKGVILWVAHFTQGPLGAKLALHHAGHPASHLSHPRHGFSKTRFGARVLNAVRRRAEDRYLAERVMLARDSAAGALERLTSLLAANRVVSITAGPTARRPHHTRFGDGTLILAGGAVALAYSTGAALLPMIPVRDGATVRVAIEAPLTVDAGLARGAAMTAAAQEYATRMEPWVARYPGQWLGWFHTAD